MRAMTVMFVLIAVFTTGLIGCGGEEGPENDIMDLFDPVDDMMDAIQAKDYEKAVSYMDIDGICEELRLQIVEIAKDLPEEDKKKMEKDLVEITPESTKQKMIKFFKDNYDMKEFTYETTEVSDHEESTAVITVKFTLKDGETEEQKYPIKKIGGVWKVSAPEM